MESLDMSKATQRGFTLIELVVVIVILGILAAFALPKFMGLETQARIASLRAMEGSLRSSAAMAHSMWLANGGVNFNVEGLPVTMANQYPNLATIPNTLQTGTVQAGTPGRFTYVAASGQFQLNGATAAANCYVSYAQATLNAANQVVPPVIAITSGGC
jgi:MSHA pilin protein MshA